MDPDNAQFIEVDGLRIRYFKGPERTGLPLLITSPWPESIFAFHRIWPRLTDQSSVVAVDLPGFGLSEGRAEIMSPSGIGGFIPKIMHALGLQRVHAVGPDVGTPAFLFAASTRPELFESLVVGGGATAADTAGATLRDLIFLPSLAQFEGLDGAVIALAAIDRMMGSKLPDGIRSDFATASAGKRFMQAAAFVRSYPSELAKLGEALPTIATPVLSIWGENDPIVPPTNALLLIDRLPRSKAVYLDASHFAWEDQPEAYAAAVMDWLGGGYRRA